MTLRASLGVAALVAAASLGFATASRATDPILPTPTTATVSVPARYHGRTARAWARAEAQQRANSEARGKSLRRLKRAASVQATSGIYGTIRAFLCIHGGEGSWTDPNPPYWGGVQMDLQFMRTYGSWALARWGTADRWPPDVQIVVALTAYYSGRGFYPWPNTARACGLI